jgi:hypothetical protein
MDDNQALKQRLLVQAKALYKKSEPVRAEAVTELFCNAAAFGVSAEADIFQAAYGDPNGREYWDSHLSEPISVHKLARILSAHQKESVPDMEHAILRAFRVAAEAREPWFTGETAPLLTMEDSPTSFGELAKVKVHPGAAVEWLLTKPMRAFLVPESLRRHLQASSNVEPRDDPKPPLPDVDDANVICRGEDKSQDVPGRATPQSTPGRGAKTRGITEAIDQLWPNGLPKGLIAKTRNKAVIDWLTDKGYSVPINPERAIQRVLKARSSK